MRRWSVLLPVFRAFAAIWVVALPVTTASIAQECGENRFSAIIDKTGEDLRAQNSASQSLLRGKFLALARAKGWRDEAAVERAYLFVRDEKMKLLDRRASSLFIRLNSLGDTTQGDVTCKRLTELKGVAKELLVVSQEKTAYLAQRLEAAVSKGPAATAVKPEAMAKATPSGPAAAPVRPAAQPRRAEQPKPWATTTEKAPWPAPTVMAALPKLQQVPQETYSAGEIRAAGRGLFGSLSAELAGVIEFAFNRYGSPNGYILGTEGGVAFLAGLRYGEGRLVTKLKGAHPVHWQGPSLGYDVGLAGSRVMFLVYNLKDIKRLYSRFLGVEGAAYLVGGAGITFHQRGDLVLAPIRTGLGLRLGANIGYLKFTREPSLNPF